MKVKKMKAKKIKSKKRIGRKNIKKVNENNQIKIVEDVVHKEKDKEDNEQDEEEEFDSMEKNNEIKWSPADDDEDDDGDYIDEQYTAHYLNLSPLKQRIVDTKEKKRFTRIKNMVRTK